MPPLLFVSEKKNVMSTAKLNAVGHRWVGPLSDLHFEIRYKPGKLNIDADTLSHCPLDINDYMSQCSEILSEEAVCATWEGSRTAQQGEVASVASLNITSQQQTHRTFPCNWPKWTGKQAAKRSCHWENVREWHRTDWRQTQVFGQTHKKTLKRAWW